MTANSNYFSITSIWEFSTERIVSRAIDVYEMADDIAWQLSPHTKQVRDAVVELDLKATLQFVIHFSTHDEVSTPAIGFSNQVLALLRF